MADHEAKDEDLKSSPSQSTSELVFQVKVDNYVGSVFIIHCHPHPNTSALRLRHKGELQVIPGTCVHR